MVGDILQPTHLLFVLVIALLVLGPKRLPEVGRAIGDGLRDFRSAINGEGHRERDGIGREYGPDGSGKHPGHEFAGVSPPPVDTPPQVGDSELIHQEPIPDDHEFAAGDAVAPEPAATTPQQVADSVDEHEFVPKADSAQTRGQPPT